MRYFSFSLLIPLFLFSNPSGERVVLGEVVISRDADVLQASQMSDKAVVEWADFSIGAHETVRFVQPSQDASVLNQVTGGNLSEIYGKLEANGRVLLLNPRGILFGKSGRIDVGAFLASTLNLVDGDFSQKDGLVLSGEGGKIVYEAEGIAREGDFTLVAPRIEMTGKILHPKGKSRIFETCGIYIRTFDEEEVQEAPLYSLAVRSGEEKEAMGIKRVGKRVFLGEANIEKTLWDHLLYESIVLGLPFGSEPSLRALQQIRTVIPERLWLQEFCLLFNRKAMRKPVVNWSRHHSYAKGEKPTIEMGRSERYYLQTTLSGEWIRILDAYGQFLESPFWKTPMFANDLRKMERRVLEARR